MVSLVYTCCYECIQADHLRQPEQVGAEVKRTVETGGTRGTELRETSRKSRWTEVLRRGRRYNGDARVARGLLFRAPPLSRASFQPDTFFFDFAVSCITVHSFV